MYFVESSHLAVLFFVDLGLDFREVVEDVEGPDVELVNGQDERIASDDKGKRTDFGNAVCNADGKLSLKVLGTFLKEGCDLGL